MKVIKVNPKSISSMLISIDTESAKLIMETNKRYLSFGINYLDYLDLKNCRGILQYFEPIIRSSPDRPIGIFYDLNVYITEPELGTIVLYEIQ